MKKFYLNFVLIIPSLFCYLIGVCQSDFSVGTWRDHLPYSKANAIAKVGAFMYASTPYSLVEFNIEDNEITRYSKINGLSEIGIVDIESNADQNTLIIAYSSGNIDLIKDGNIINISAILNSNIIGDKNIYELYAYEKYVYVCAGFGIVVIDLQREEVKDTYIIGQNNTQLKIRDIHISTDSIFALTDFGILAANKSASFLSDYNNWNSINVPSPFSIEHLESVNENFIAYGNQNTLWSYTGSWKVILDNPNQQVRKVRHINDQLVVSTSSYATVYESNLNTLEDTVLLFYALNGVTGIVPNDFYITDDFYWLADETKGFSRVRNNFNAEIISNSGPFTNEAFHLSCNHGKLYIAAGRVDGSNWNKTFNWHGVFTQYEDDWSMYNQITNSNMATNIDTISDILWVTPHPVNKDEFYASSYGGGLLHFKEDVIENRYSFYNSSLQTRIGQGSNNVLVTGTAFDNQQNLWVVNPYTNSPLSVRTPEGDWKSFYCGSQASDQLCTDIVLDNQYGYVWMVVRGVGILVYDYNQTPLDESDDQYKYVTTSSGSGSLPSSYVNTLSIDLDGVIWIGTDIGPVQFYSSYPIFNENSYNAQRILIEDNGTIQYLLENQLINDIVIDGANRKWIATNGGGLFLMSEDGTNTVYSFSTDNSPLFNNEIKALTLDNLSGELFIATEQGLLGFKSTAITASQTFSTLSVYPNPVRENYYGNIAVTGMMFNSEVKITDANGLLVNTIQSNGGQAVWNGKNFNSEDVQSGVYYFFATSEDGYRKAKGKVLVVR